MAKRILYVANVDWFFESHFLHLARSARSHGFEVALATHVDQAGPRLAAAGLELIDLPARRGRLAPTGLFAAASIIASDLMQHPQTVMHAFGLFGIAVGSWAGRRRRYKRNVYTITGLGFSAAASTSNARVVRAGVRHVCAGVADGPGVRWLAENPEDLSSCGLAKAVEEGRTAIVGGAGVDPDLFACAPMPARPPLRVAVVARMIWSKGIDTAVEAVRIARERGVDVELTLAGGTDPGNPRAYSPADLEAFERAGGVQWLGRVENINGLWAQHHLCLLPSRGGEGLPKSLIEASSCGRPVLTTDVPGCRSFAKETGGWCVAPESPEAVADALCRIATLDDLEAHGEVARTVVLDRFTEQHNWEIVSAAYNALAGWPE